ncbi:UDP-N-acetylmuramoyl-L-alanine--D-glutamate ligase [Rhodovibrio salinarum]|uniref:UDP-N-acetylmuramoylalanine--D-glutamate ligase n=1 Tax=Rhodovibrio salinarum TaxID=1087 RepID=A0A934QGR9_9PROT|nr:UDP-N-acetylmuramoyl-L-alanine--D-glutamate ligase [Rhodovibrio salinarum]MBK1696498.1 UDP-N-acetylmuramoyl-L-alanine--D-glutamate ligase [Rhodovibrio salinarum]
MIPLPYMAGFPVAVLGLGRSGLQAAKALQRSDAEVWAWDDNASTRARAEAEGVNLKNLYEIDWREPVTLVLSPGIPDRLPQPHPLAAKAHAAGCEIVSDIELLGRAVPDASYIGITGTNGKSTTTALIGHVLNTSGKDAQVGGNLGPSVLDFAPVEPGGYYVLEMSSYQLERTASITFDVAVWLNISADHLDRHGDMAGYIAAKKNIFRRQTSPRAAVVGVDDDASREVYAGLQAAGDQVLIPISGTQAVAGGVGVAEGALVDDIDGQQAHVLDLAQMASLPGQHNWQNAAAAYAACRQIGVQSHVIAACLQSFPGLPHRQEPAATIDGVAFVNDSKATNADAASRALACYRAIYWIAGGRAKEGGLAGTESYWPRVRRAYLIGEAENDFAQTLQGKVTAQVCGTLDTAVARAFADAKADGETGAVVLLSPACASFDQFQSFEARGDHFKDLVGQLNGTREEIDRRHLSADAGGSA